jgi:hypothetical protein
MIKITGIKEAIDKAKIKLGNELDGIKNNRMNTMVHALKAATPVDTGEARDAWRVEGSAIVNDSDHIQYLNNGSSKQAPDHFIEKTLLSQPGITPSGIIVKSK